MHENLDRTNKGRPVRAPTPSRTGAVTLVASLVACLVKHDRLVEKDIMSLHTSQKDVEHYQRAFRLVDGCCCSAKSWTGQGQAERSFLRLIGSDRDSASLHQAGLVVFGGTATAVRASPAVRFLEQDLQQHQVVAQVICPAVRTIARDPR